MLVINNNNNKRVVVKTETDGPDSVQANILQVNSYRLTESDFRFDVTLSRWRSWRHFTQPSAATWWVNTKSLLMPMQQRTA